MAIEGFDAAAARDKLIDELKNLGREEGFSKVVIGISGGKDSTVCAALCARAFGPENVYGIMMPDGVQADIEDSKLVCASTGINSRVVNIGPMHKALLAAVDEDTASFPVAYSKESDINVCPRLRMTTLRYFAQALGARLCGTGNLSESTVGYCTKDGDTSCDFALLGDLTSKEVVEVGLTMEELPRQLVDKAPSDGLSGVPDEVKLGITYQAIHDYIRKGTSGDAETDEKIRRKEKGSEYKRRMPKILRAH